MKLYIISGLGADFTVLNKLKFNPELEIVFIDWLIPSPDESFESYVSRMAESVDASEEFFLLGYSFGGIVVQEIHKLKPAKKVVIMGSIRCDAEKSLVMKAGQFTRLGTVLPKRLFNDKMAEKYGVIRSMIDPSSSKLMDYFTVRDPYYLKWSVAKILAWKMDKIPEVIQIMGDKDIVFPLKNSQPDYVIQNGSHLFPATKHKEVSSILLKEFSI